MVPPNTRFYQQYLTLFTFLPIFYKHYFLVLLTTVSRNIAVTIPREKSKGHSLSLVSSGQPRKRRYEPPRRGELVILPHERGVLALSLRGSGEGYETTN